MTGEGGGGVPDGLKKKSTPGDFWNPRAPLYVAFTVTDPFLVSSLQTKRAPCNSNFPSILRHNFVFKDLFLTYLDKFFRSTLHLLGIVSSRERYFHFSLWSSFLPFLGHIKHAHQVRQWIPSQFWNHLSQWRRYWATPHLGIAPRDADVLQALCREMYGWRE